MPFKRIDGAVQHLKDGSDGNGATVGLLDFLLRQIGKARGLSEDAVRAIVEAHVEGQALGLFGEPTVNVLTLNLALDTAG